MKQILTYNAPIRDGLETFLGEKRAAGSAIRWQTDLLDRLLPFVTGGKLLRGSLVCFAYETFAEQPPPESVLRAAMALELTHSALLIHDDIMDKDATRRGQLSFHEQYRALAEHQADHFGSSMAMCVGDAALFMAFELLANCPAPVVQLFTDQLAATCAGQMQDLYLESGRANPSKQAIYELMKAKTAAYTLALPLAMGAALASQPAPVLEQLRQIGVKAGVIFQIRDDELAITGDARKTGKPVGSDIIEGKKTLLHYYLLRACGAAERKKIANIFGNSAATAADIRSVQHAVKKYDITKLLNYEIDALAAQARAVIHDLNASEAAKKELAELIRFCGQRQS